MNGMRRIIDLNPGEEITIRALTATDPVPPSPPTPTPTEHNPRLWHGVVADDGTVFGHEHHDDPHELDDVFGPLPDYLGGEISYPWETHAENEHKHRVYGWAVIKGDGSVMATNGEYGIVHARYQGHMDGAQGATTRYHSFWMQAKIGKVGDQPSDYGEIEIGGHMDFGQLLLATTQGEVHVPLPGDPVKFVPAQRFHGSVNIPTAKERPDWTWYGHHRIVTVGYRQDRDTGPIDPNDPFTRHVYNRPFETRNNSQAEPLHLLTIALPRRTNDPDERVNIDGFVDRYGNNVSEGPLGPDCVPFKVRNARPGYYQFRSGHHGFGVRDYDVLDANGKSLIELPN